MSLEPYNKTFKMSSPSDSSSCTSTVDEVMGKLSEFAPYDDSCEPLATEKEAADYNERVHREQEEEQQCQRMNGMVLSWNVDLYFYFPISTYPSLNVRVTNATVFVAM